MQIGDIGGVDDFEEKAAVRGALNWLAITAIRYNSVVRVLAQRLGRQRKSANVIIAAAMRKLIHLAYGVLKHKRPLDPNWVLNLFRQRSICQTISAPRYQ